MQLHKHIQWQHSFVEILYGHCLTCRFKNVGWLSEVKVSCSFCHRGAKLILAYITVGQGLLSLQQVSVEGECCYFFSSFTFFHCPLSSLPLSFIFSTISSVSFLPYFGRRHQMSYKGWHQVSFSPNTIFDINFLNAISIYCFYVSFSYQWLSQPHSLW